MTALRQPVAYRIVGVVEVRATAVGGARQPVQIVVLVGDRRRDCPVAQEGREGGGRGRAMPLRKVIDDALTSVVLLEKPHV